jgi:hypothetical protein
MSVCAMADPEAGFDKEHDALWRWRASSFASGGTKRAASERQ